MLLGSGPRSLTAVVGIASSVGCASLGHGPSPVPLQGSQAHQVGAQFDAPILLSLPEGTSLLDYGFGSTLWYRQKVGTDLELIVESGANISGAILPFGNVAVRKYLRDQEGPPSALRWRAALDCSRSMLAFRWLFVWGAVPSG